MEYFNDIKTFNEKMKRLEKMIFVARFFKNKKLILTSLEEQAYAGKLLIKSILKYKHAKNEIILTSNLEQNLEILKTKIATEWEIENEIKEILDLIKLNKKHKESTTEFLRKGVIIILDENQNIEKITIEKLKITLNSIKNLKNRFEFEITPKNYPE